MSYMYIVESGGKLEINGGFIQMENKDGSIKKVPKETVEAISIFGNAQLTTPCFHYCLKNGIRVSFFSKSGSFFGYLHSTSHVNIFRQKKQIFLTENPEFAIGLAKKLIEAKIHNQQVVVKRYLRNTNIDVEEELFQISNSLKKISGVQELEQLIGYEGIASRSYFKILSKLLDEKWGFQGRNRRPPRDPVNSMLSLGYTILMYELYGEIENRGLNPYAGFLHQDKEQHPTLASDMMEEWRAVLVDSIVLSLVQGHEIEPEHFYYNEESEACMMTKEGLKIFLKKLENKMHTEVKYLEEYKERMSFRRVIWHQMGYLVRAIESGDVAEYKPLRIR